MERIQKTARKITNASRRKVIGRFHSRKMKVRIPFESMPERNYMLYLDSAPDVRAFYSQPQTIQYLNSDNHLVKYTTDLKVVFFSTERIKNVEVKAEDTAEYDEVVEKHKLLTTEFARRGEDFEVVTTEFTDKQPELNNRQILHMYGGVFVPSDIKVRIADFFEKNEVGTIGDLQNILKEEKDAIQYIYALVFQNDLFIDMAFPISEKSKLKNK